MTKKDILIGALFAVLLALFISPFASKWPDGLERVAEDKGFLHKSEGVKPVHAPLAGYLMPGIKNEKLATVLAGVFGTLFVLALGSSIAWVLHKNKK